jgi:hypothetical protein
VHGRQEGEDYGPLVARLGLDALVKTIAKASAELHKPCAAQASSAGRQSVRFVVLPAFSGLTSLPDDPAELLKADGTATSQGGGANPASG